MKKETLCLLRDPLTFDDLAMENNYLINAKSRKKYCIEDGFVQFIDENAIQGPNKVNLTFSNNTAKLYNTVENICIQFNPRGVLKNKNEFLSELEIKNGARVLEVSVGTGTNLRYINNYKDIKFYGFDLSSGMLKQAVRQLNKSHIECELFQGEAEHLPFKDEVFDVVFHIGGIDGFSDKRQAVSELIRVAKSGSKILISDETEKMILMYQKIPFLGRLVKNSELPDPLKLIPKTMKEITMKEISRGKLYCVTFRKP